MSKQLNFNKYAQKKLKISELTLDEFEDLSLYLQDKDCIIEELDLKDFKFKQKLFPNKSPTDAQMTKLMRSFISNTSVKKLDLTNVKISLNVLETLKKVLLGTEDLEPNTSLESIIYVSDKEKLCSRDLEELNKIKDKSEKTKELNKLQDSIDENLKEITGLLEINKDDKELNQSNMKPVEHIRKRSDPLPKFERPKSDEPRRKSEPNIPLSTEAVEKVKKPLRTSYAGRKEAEKIRQKVNLEAITPLLRELKIREKDEKRKSERTQTSPHNSNKPG